MLVIHYTGMTDNQEAIKRLCDPNSVVSTHYVIDDDGKCLQLVDENNRAWHAGVSFWAGNNDINSCSIGVELCNPGHEHGYKCFPEKQMATLLRLGRDILAISFCIASIGVPAAILPKTGISMLLLLGFF